MCQTASLPISAGLDRRIAPSETSSLLDSFVVLDLDLQNAALRSYRCASGALPLF